MKGIRFLLYPFAVLFDLITRVRNRLYDRGYKPSASFEVATIGVGNLAVGGTGKSPMIEHLTRVFQQEGYRVATLSRGYGRKTKGVRIASGEDNASTIGDEPFQFYRKFEFKVPVVVSEERALAIPYIMDEFPDVDIILLDDAFQHRKVKPDFQLLLTDHGNLFYRDFLLPVGLLRESKIGSKRADSIIVTKCPAEIEEEEMIAIEKKIREFSSVPVFFSTVHYGELVPFGASLGFVDSVILVTGIANAKGLVQHVSSNYQLIKHLEFADHHEYTRKDVSNFASLSVQEKALILTTEKDAVKLDAPAFKDILSKIPIAYLPIEVEFIKNGKDFDEMVLSVLKKHKKNA